MSRRPTAPPPTIEGYRYLKHLGTGGFANVYLYEQDRPRRRVAIKVLMSDLLTETAKRSFEAEANLMAQLSSHPYIVTIYEANITADNHFYLAMEYCSRPSLDERYKAGRLGLEEALSLGIQVASAVETAHRSGIAHRDIKPANILTTDYNRPALTDFGISGTTDSLEDEDQGMSIPWSPPEALRGGRTDGIPMDIWALGATVYTLLAGRSPFVLPAGSNSQRELIDRIESSPLKPTGRADVPAAMEQALATAMAKSPEARYASAYEFALALQRVQSELNFATTEFEVLEETVVQPEVGEDSNSTRVRSVVSISPDGRPTPHPVSDRPVGDAGLLPPTAATAGSPSFMTEGRDGSTRGEWTGKTFLRGADPATVAEHPPGPPTSTKRRNRLVTAAVVVAVAAVAAVGAGAVLNGTAEPEPEVPAFTQPPPDASAGLEANVPPPEGLSGVPEGSEVVFTWVNPDQREGDLYIWRTVTATEEGEPVRTLEPRAVVQAEGAGEVCIEVQVVRLNGKASDPAAACSPEQ